MHFFKSDKQLKLEGGTTLPSFTLAYQTFGRLNANATNVIWVVHALTANSNCVEWWKGLFDESGIFNTKDWYIVCANNLGSCYGSTGPLSPDEKTGIAPYASFPTITIRDIAASLEILRAHLNLQVHTIVAGSMGAQIAQEWIMHGLQVQQAILLATNAKHTAWGIAFNESQRMAIYADKTYYSNTDEGGKMGLQAARSIALLSYRSYSTYEISQTNTDDRIDNFKASQYQNYQGLKLSNRFDAYSYVCLSKAMDSHNLMHQHRSMACWSSVKTLVIGIDSDILFPMIDQIKLAALVKGEFVAIKSNYGHDGFLIETTQINNAIKKFIQYPKKNKTSTNTNINLLNQHLL
jgi:homoserine O-acetyltransferase/O-succinyltransferase